MPPKKLAAKKPVTVEESSIAVTPVVTDLRTSLLNFFTNDELSFMLNQKYIPRKKNKIGFDISLKYIDEHFIDIYPLKLYSKNFQDDFIKSIYTSFDTSLFDDMKQKEQDEIVFLTTKPKATSGIMCPRCKSLSTRTEMKQVRSGDEAMDEFIECLSCKYKGKYQ